MHPAWALALVLSPAQSTDSLEHQRFVAPFLAKHCAACHGPKKQSGGVRLDKLTAAASRDAGLWLQVRDQLRDGLMPPAKQPRPDGAEARRVVAWVTRATGGQGGRLPRQGNLIPHELLFGEPPAGAPAPPPRVWRLSPKGYMGLVQSVLRGKPEGIIQPFTLGPERGFRDYAGLYTIDEPSTEVLIRNSELIVAVMAGTAKGKGGVRELAALMKPGADFSPASLEKAIQVAYGLAICRKAGPDEVKRLIGLYEKCAKDGDRPAAVRTMLQAVLLKTDALFRSELGRGKAEKGRRMLAPGEIAVAVSLALGERRDTALMAAAEKGQLKTREQVAAHVRRILDAPKGDASGLLRFFREYFDYGHADNVFKNKPKGFAHEPGQLVADTDRLVLHVLAKDKDVLRTLLTTDESFVNLKFVKNKKLRRDEPKQAVVIPPPRKREKPRHGLEHVYGVEKWSAEQPMKMPKGTRLGILMQPSWLVAWSTNFDNDPVRRGRWVRERLLGGNVPELPIGVAAQVPDEPHRTFRDRLKVTRAPACWKCHDKMDELGLAFEQFDHFGRFRTAEEVLDPEATRKNVDRKGKPLGDVMRQAKLDTTGAVTGTGDAKLDGPVKGPQELVLRLAKSPRVRQVFVRHAFRFFLGRNESLSDARTLQEADRAYVASGGSFKALVTSLLTSDSFLYRSAPGMGEK